MRKNKLFSRYQQSKKDRNLKNDNFRDPVFTPVFHDPSERFRVIRRSPYVTANWNTTAGNISPEMWEEEDDEE